MQFFVLIRFSLLSKRHARSWKIGRRDKEDYVESLFDEARLQQRFRLFELITLPSLTASIATAKGLDIAVILISSSDLPAWAKLRLIDLVGRIPWLRIQLEQPEDASYSRFTTQSLVASRGRLYATVRLDDDDALGRNYFNELSNYMTGENVGSCVTFENGVAGIYEGEGFQSFHLYRYRKSAQGLAFIQHIDNVSSSKFITVYDLGNHTQVDRVVKLNVDSKKFMFFRTIHVKSDAFDENLRIRAERGQVLHPSDVELEFSIKL